MCVCSLVYTLQGAEGQTVYEYRVLRKILGPRKQEVTGDWRKLQNEADGGTAFNMEGSCEYIE